MSQSSESSKIEHKYAEDPNVIQLGFNISVAGKSASDFEIYVNDKKQACGQLSTPNLKQLTSSSDLQGVDQVGPNAGLVGERSTGQSSNDKPSEPGNKISYSPNKKYPMISAPGEAEASKMDRNEESTIIDEIKNAMGNFERFSEHLREIPRLTTKRVYTSTPYPDKSNSRSEGNLPLYGHASRSFIPKHDFRDRKYFRKSKPLPSDLFLKPLPAEDYLKKGFIRRYCDVESFHHYSSMDSLTRYYEFDGDYKTMERNVAKSDNDKSDIPSSSSDVCASETKGLGSSKKRDAGECAEKQSTSSESAKDIKIYQSGGIIIMQNFSENPDIIEKKGVLDSSKPENSFTNLKEKAENSLQSSDDSQRVLLNSSSDEVKGPSGKSVQFDLSSCENTKSKSGDSSAEFPKNECIPSLNVESSNSKAEPFKIKENTVLNSQNQDFTSLSTQENDSIISNLLGMSPTSSTSGKKLEWDSGADIGYLNLDLSKENISTIERIILKALNDGGIAKKPVAHQKSEEDSGVQTTKFIFEKVPSELELGVSEHTKDLSTKKSNSDESMNSSKTKSNASSKSNEISDCVQVTRHRLRGDIEDISRERSVLKGMSNRAEHHTGDTTFPENKKAKHPKSTKYHEKAKKQKGIPSGAILVNTEEKIVQTHKLEKDILSADKSTYVNTLFSDRGFELPLHNISRSEESGRSESSEKCRSHFEKSPRVKKFRKKKNIPQGNNLTARLQDKIDTIIDIARYSSRNDEKSKPLPREGPCTSLDQSNLNRNSEDSQFDQTHQEAQELSSEEKIVKSDSKSLPLTGKSTNPTSKDKISRSRPISASSSSVRTVLPNIDATEGTEKAEALSEVKNFSDQMIQTSERVYESKGIQAFQSLKGSTASSQIEEGNASIIDADVNRLEVIKDSDNIKLNLVCSKSIQAPGMNFSLPKHLAHPKQADLLEQLNTKSTQFFGSSITSLPNYRCNVTLRETGDKMKILKNKANPDAESNRVRQENIRNISKVSYVKEDRIESAASLESKSNSKFNDNCTNPRMKHNVKSTTKSKNVQEDKENVSLDGDEHANESKRYSNHYQDSKDGYSINNGSKKSDSIAFDSCDVQLSDEGSNVFLTSDVLKEYDHSIDRNVIQEKYFQSQLLELEKRQLVSRSTSMEKKKELDRNTQTNYSLKTGVSVSCQCSPTFTRKSEGVVAGELEADKRTRKEELMSRKRRQLHGNMSHNNSESNTIESGKKFPTLESSESDHELVSPGSLSSDTQTGLSWSRELQRSSQNQNYVVGRALSFEYLPGHIYENTKSLQDKSTSYSDCNLNICDSVQSDNCGSTTKSSSQPKESGSGHTIILENTDRSLLDSDRMKSLGHNLTELEIVVCRLHEKEAIFQKITDSMLSTVVKANNGSGDSTNPLAGEIKSNNNSQDTDEIYCELDILEDSSKSNSSKPKPDEKNLINNEVSTACQTDAAVASTDEFYEERRKLEQRMNDEKEQQIKWIENEINHLNMLRSLLEKQDSRNASQRRKRHHYLTEANEESPLANTLKNEILKKISGDSLPKTDPTLDDIIIEDESKSKAATPVKSVEDCVIETVKDFEGLPDTLTHCSQLGMAMSLRQASKVQEVTMLPVGIQVTLGDRKTSEGGSSSLGRKSVSSSPLQPSENRNADAPAVISLDVRPSTSGTHHSSKSFKVNGGSSNVTVLTVKDSKGHCKCAKCHRSKCICLNSCDTTSRQKSCRGNLKPSRRDEEDSNKTCVNGSTNTSEDLLIPAIGDINSQGASTLGTSSPEITRSRETSRQNQSYVSSEISNKCEKCVCGCHAEPLPRCERCSLLKTCRKCLCYRRIQCCACKVSSCIGSPQKKFATGSSSCLCKNDACHMCRCSKKKNQICSLCSCHKKKSSRETGSCNCKKKYEERSCQTDEKECKCCECNLRKMDEADLYRETKHMAEKLHLTEVRRPAEVSYPSEQRYETEVKQPIDGKFPFEMKVPIEKKNRAETKDSVEVKNEIERMRSYGTQPIRVKELKGKSRCCCQNQNVRGKAGEHPRNYFLQLEETAEDDSSESCDNRKSLEVITIKVPIRKVFKSKRNQSLSPKRNAWKSIPEKENGDKYPERLKYVRQEQQEKREFTCCPQCVRNTRKPNLQSNQSEAADDNYMPHRPQYGERNKYIQCRVEELHPCKCCKDCPGHWSGQVFDEQGPEFTFGRRDEFEEPNHYVPHATLNADVMAGDSYQFSSDRMVQYSNSQNSRFPPNEYRYHEKENGGPGECYCCKDCPGRINNKVKHEEEPSDYPSEETEFSSTAVDERLNGSVSVDNSEIIQEKKEKYSGKVKSGKVKKGGSPKQQRKGIHCQKPGQPNSSPNTKNPKAAQEKYNGKPKASDYYDFNKKEYMTKSELEREEKKRPNTRLTLQECLTVKRPDLFTRAECRRKIITEKARDRAERHNKRMECLTKLLPQCYIPGNDADMKLFTSAQMRKQTKKFYRKLPEVTNKQAEEKKKMQFRTNKLMAEIFAKKLQLQTLKGCLNLSNSYTVMSTM